MEKIIDAFGADESIDCPFCGGVAYEYREFCDDTIFIRIYQCEICGAVASADYDFNGKIKWRSNDQE